MRTHVIDRGRPLGALIVSMLLVATMTDAGATPNVGAWGRRAGGTGSEQAYTVATDHDGNVIAAGWSSSPTIDLGGGALAGAGSFDIVVAKYSPAGAHQWSKRWGGSDLDQAYTVAVDPDGNVFVGGTSRSSSIDFGGGVLAGAGSDDAVLVKLSPSGDHLWSRRVGSPASDVTTAVATDAEGNVIVAGWSPVSPVDLGGGPLLGKGSYDLILGKFSTDGAHVWSTRLGGAGVDWPRALATDTSGDVLVAGVTQSASIDLGAGAVANAGKDDIVLAKLSSATGAHIWSKVLGGSTVDQPWGVATDLTGGVVVAGFSSSTAIDLGGGPRSGLGAQDMIVARYDADGAHRWSKRLGGTGEEYAFSVATDPVGNAVIAGTTGSRSIDLGGDPLVGDSPFSFDIVAAMYAPSGVHIWSTRLGGDNIDVANGVASDPSGNVIISGYSLSTSIDLGDGPLAGAGAEDWLVGKFTEDVTAPASAFDAPPSVLSELASVRLTGTATDDLAGVASVDVTYVNVVTGAQVVVAAQLSCAAPNRRSCTFSAQGPGAPGVWSANARARDRVANTETTGPNVQVVAIP